MLLPAPNLTLGWLTEGMPALNLGPATLAWLLSALNFTLASLTKGTHFTLGWLAKGRSGLLIYIEPSGGYVRFLLRSLPSTTSQLRWNGVTLERLFLL